MWDEVRRLTKSSNAPPPSGTLTADTLNQHYSRISSDLSYQQPSLKLTASPVTSPVTEFCVFKLLNKLRTTASGPDNLPFWFLRLAAPFISRPLTHLINLSLLSSTVPTQWKSAVIHPIPKISAPVDPSGMRPISVVSILSRLTERLVVKNFLNPATVNLQSLSNQFAYRPTCSATAALISILAHITHLLETNSHVFVLTFDYSKAFDTLSHLSVANTLSTISIPDSIYNWTLDYLTGRSHFTTFDGRVSDPASFNAGIVQGSVLGPSLFNITSSTLTPQSSLNTYFKYADDGYLVVPGSNASSIPTELLHHSAWAAEQNLKLNLAKTSEIVFSSKRSKAPPPPLNSGVDRVSTLKILGVLVDDRLTFLSHVTETVKNCSQSLFALRTLRHHGLPDKALYLTFSSKLLSKLTYASPAWWGFISAASNDQLEAFIRKAQKFNYYSKTQPCFSQMVDKIESDLFRRIEMDPHHCLHPLLPPLKSSNYGLRKRGHSYMLPTKDDRNFVSRLLYKLL